MSDKVNDNYYEIMSKQHRNENRAYIPKDEVAEENTPERKVHPSALYSTKLQAIRDRGMDPGKPGSVSTFGKIMSSPWVGLQTYDTSVYNPYRPERYGSKK